MEFQRGGDHAFENGYNWEIPDTAYIELLSNLQPTVYGETRPLSLHHEYGEPGNVATGATQPQLLQTYDGNRNVDSAVHVVTGLAPADMQAQETWGMPCHPQTRFDSPEAAQKAINAFARGYAVVVKSNSYDKKALGPSYTKKMSRRLVVFGCDRHGKRREHNGATGSRPDTATRRSGCGMEVRVVRICDPSNITGTPSLWLIEHRATAWEHNHPPSTSPSAHPVHRRATRTPAMRQTVTMDQETGVQPSQTLVRIRARLQAVLSAGQSLRPDEFHSHWRIRRELAAPTIRPVVIEPLSIRARRQERSDLRRSIRGGGVWGTRRGPSPFERSLQSPPVLL